MWSGISCQRSIAWNGSLKHDNYDSNFKHDKLFFAASHSRGTKPPCRRAKIALGQDKTKDIHNFKWQFPLFVLSQWDCCSPARRFYTTKFCIRAYLHGGGGPQVGEVTFVKLPHLTCKRDHIKMRDYLDRRVTPPKRVPSPTWGPPPPYKRALVSFSSTQGTIVTPKRKLKTMFIQDFAGKTIALLGTRESQIL